MPIGLALGGHESWRLMTALVNTMDCSRISWKLLLNVNRLIGGRHYPYCERVSCGACKIDVKCSVSLAEDSGVIAPLSGTSPYWQERPPSNVLSGCSTSSWKPYFSAVRRVKFASRSNSLWLCHVGHWKWHPLMPLTSLASMSLHLPQCLEPQNYCACTGFPKRSQEPKSTGLLSLGRFCFSICTRQKYRYVSSVQNPVSSFSSGWLIRDSLIECDTLQYIGEYSPLIITVRVIFGLIPHE